ncbi:hypothetical protein GOODEAATRI_004997 [Goodea atripinnis]|uniref:Uncharacterized protein n=1 Tax=Goodea atripinnis TaxID=208336 RepID=A0ABV0NS05_9TELE
MSWVTERFTENMHITLLFLGYLNPQWKNLCYFRNSESNQFHNTHFFDAQATGEQPLNVNMQSTTQDGKAAAEAPAKTLGKFPPNNSGKQQQGKRKEKKSCIVTEKSHAY